MKKTPKKLTLAKETLRDLETQGELKGIAGAYPPFTIETCTLCRDC